MRPRLARRARAAVAAVAASGVAGFVLIGVGLASLPAAADAVPTSQGSVTDRLADVLDPQATSVTLASADITGASLEYAPAWIRMELRTFSATDPVADPNWLSDNTFAVWSLDTTGDGTVDYLVEYGITSDKELYGDVVRPGDGPNDPAVCSADSVTYASSVTGGVYTLRVDPSCLGHPAAIAYTVGISYDSGGGRGAGPVGTDIVPDRGFAVAVPAPAASPPPTTPAGLGPEMLVTPPSTAPASNDQPAGPAPQSNHKAMPPTGATPATTAARPPAAPVVPARGSAASTPTRPPAAPSPVVRELPRTGANRLGPLAAVGFGIVLMVAGLLVMVRPVESCPAGY